MERRCLRHLRPIKAGDGAVGRLRRLGGDVSPTKYATLRHFFDFFVMTDFVTLLHASFGHKVATMIKHVKGAFLNRLSLGAFFRGCPFIDQIEAKLSDSVCSNSVKTEISSVLLKNTHFCKFYVQKHEISEI